MNSKQLNRLLVIVISLIVLFLVVYNLSFLKSRTICGKIIGEHEIKGAKYIRYRFIIDNDTSEGSLSVLDVKRISLDSLKKIECVQIQYSEFSSFFNRVVDKRILKK